LTAGRVGERPIAGHVEQCAATLATELRADAVAAALALPAASSRRQVAQAALSTTALRQKETICLTAGEAALDLLPQLVAAQTTVLKVQDRMEGVARALQALADAGQLPASPGGNAAERIVAAVALARREAAVARDDAVGMELSKSARP
jgi:hypothetical protein